MDIEKYLIMIKGEDKTSDIVNYVVNSNHINIKFKNTEKEYTYHKSDFECYKTPTTIDIMNKYITVNGGYVYHVEKVLKFEKYYKLFFSDNKVKSIPVSQIEFVTQAPSTNKFEYYKEISKIVSIKTEEGSTFLGNEYEKINLIEKDTALYKYLNANKELETIENKRENFIFPFGANESQFEAVKRAMTNQISIIEGPPGTGKTQTILNIIANIIKQGQTVAVVSNNNAATDNIYEKLKKDNLDYLCAVLGRKENKEEFIKHQTGKYPKFQKELTDREKYENGIEKLNQDISKIFAVQNKIAKQTEQLNQVKVEHQYFNKQEKEQLQKIPRIRNINRITSDIIMKLKMECEALEEQKHMIHIWFKIKSGLIYGIGNGQFYRNTIKDLINYYNKMYFIVKEIELSNEIKKQKKELQELGSNKLPLLISNSMKLLQEYVRIRYKGKEERKRFEIQDLYKNSNLFNEEYPIILSTTHSVKSCLNISHKFDYLIVDEASQVDLITGVLALSTAKNAVIVGDLKQLPNIVTTDNRKQIEEISKKYNIEEPYDYLKHSFLSSMIQVRKKVARTLLKEHYRCHPKIIGFCNKKFYNNELIVMTEDKGEEDILKVYVTKEGNHARGHLNQRQIDIIQKEVMPELSNKIRKEEIGVISPYKKQKEGLEGNLEDNIQIDTVHKFQGREKEAIIITTVDNEISEFVDDPKMLNVAITRAKKYLRLVVSNNKQNKGTNIEDLIKYIQYHNFEIVESKVKSIYDLLYKENRKKRMQYLKDKNRISEYESENITYHFINQILEKNHYDTLDIAVHVPLQNLLKDMEQLEEEEFRYANQTWTHIDFVLYNKMDKKLVLAIEVDGYYYHKEGTKQQERDRLKERILEKYNIPIIRWNTTGSDEETLLENKIAEIFNLKTVC